MDFYIALDQNGDIYTWGSNSSGQLGNGSSTSSVKKMPEKLSLGTKFKQISAGSRHWVAIDVNGNLWACGDNMSCAIGNGHDIQDSIVDNIVTVPVQITTGTKFTKIKASTNTTLALDSNGNIWGWGYRVGSIMYRYNYHSTHFDNYYQNVPAQLTTGREYIDIINTYQSGGAIDSNHNLYMWGLNQFGLLGAPDETYRHDLPDGTYVYRKQCTNSN